MTDLLIVIVVHWIVKLYHYGFLVKEGICLILVIQTFLAVRMTDMEIFNTDIHCIAGQLIFSLVKTLHTMKHCLLHKH